MLIILYFLSQRNKFRRRRKFTCVGLSKPENVKPSVRQPVCLLFSFYSHTAVEPTRLSEPSDLPTVPYSPVPVIT